MKKIIYLLAFVSMHGTVFSQQKLRDGIYLVDRSEYNRTASPSNKAVIQYNPFFVEEAPEVYNPIVVFTDEFVPFELEDMPVIQYRKGQDNLLLVHLTKGASEKLKTFTTKNLRNHIVVVVNGEALAIYKVIQPVTSVFIKVTGCSGTGCDQVYIRLLKSTVKI